MSEQIRNLLKEADENQKKLYYRSRILTYKRILDSYPDHTIFACFQLGALYQTELGFGDEAKNYYLIAVEWNDANPDFMKHRPGARKEIEKILASTYENLASLSDSYEEMYKWAKKLWEINPKEEIVRENIESAKRAQKMGLPWAQTYYELAGLYWNADPSRDPGLHGFGASIYQRLLSNPRKFRIDRQLYDGCANGYAGLMTLIISDIGEKMEKKYGYLIRNEFEFIIDTPTKIIENYLSKHTNERVKETLDFFYKLKKRASISNNKIKKTSSSSETKIPVFKKAMNFIASVVFPITLAMIISNNRGLDWGFIHYLVAGIIGVFIIFPIINAADKKNRSFRNDLEKKSSVGRKNKVAHCSKCSIKMPIVTGPFNINGPDEFQGCFQCSKCGRFTCYDCSDATEPCKCGNTAWIEKMYIIN